MKTNKVTDKQLIDFCERTIKKFAQYPELFDNKIYKYWIKYEFDPGQIKILNYVKNNLKMPKLEIKNENKN